MGKIWRISGPLVIGEDIMKIPRGLRLVRKFRGQGQS